MIDIIDRNETFIENKFFFGSTSGIITTLGLMVGLYSGTQSITAIIGGILTITLVYYIGGWLLLRCV